MPFAGGDFDVGDREDRRLHLAGDEAVVDERVELQLLLRQKLRDLLRRVRQIGRTDRFVGPLSVLARRRRRSAFSGRYLSPYVVSMWLRQAVSASSEMRVLSVRM